jgi:hypothetical protein
MRHLDNIQNGMRHVGCYSGSYAQISIISLEICKCKRKLFCVSGKLIRILLQWYKITIEN